MNYPYGNHCTYTGCQSLVSQPLRLMKDLGFENSSRYVLLLINLYVLLSLFLCPLFLFLVFKELKLPDIVCVLGAVFITFLSPQLQRIEGHITLSYVFVIPLILFLLLKNYNSPRLIYSILLGLFLIWSGFAHPYYLVFFAFLSIFYWGYLFFFEKERFGGRRKIIILFSVQFLVPLICFFLLSGIGDAPLDRTKIPFGFYTYRARIEGVLFPYGRPYFMKESLLFANIKWEARAYIGVIALIVFVGIVIIFFKKLFTGKFSSLLKITDNTMLNVFFWASFALLLFACGIPINWFPSRILNYLGPIAQLRALGRFEWLFFYVINIIAIYILFQFITEKIHKKQWKYALFFLFCILFIGENYAYCRQFKYWFRNEKPAWIDYDNKLEENQWVHAFSSEHYQSILPLPFFNIGTEQIDIFDKDNIFEKSAYVSIKTGLPMHTSLASRSSIKQAYNNIAFAWEPWTVFSVMTDIKSNQPILLITPIDTASLNEHEKRLVEYAHYLFTANDIVFYSLKTESIYQLCKDYRHYLQELYLANRVYSKVDGIYSNDSLHRYYYVTWGDFSENSSFQGKDALSGIINKVNILYDSIISFQENDQIEISFWMSNFTDDLYGRTKYIIVTTDKNETVTRIDCNSVVNKVYAIKNGWGLVKINISLPWDAHRLFISLQNKEMLAKPVYFDNLLIKPVQTMIISEKGDNRLLNNLNVYFDDVKN